MKAIAGSILMIALSLGPVLCAQNDYPAYSGQAADPPARSRYGTKVGEGTPSPRSMSQPNQGTLAPIGSGTTGYRLAPSARRDNGAITPRGTASTDGGGATPASRDSFGRAPSTDTAPGGSYQTPGMPPASDRNTTGGSGASTNQDPIETQPLVPGVPDNQNPVRQDFSQPDPQTPQTDNTTPPPYSGSGNSPR